MLHQDIQVRVPTAGNAEQIVLVGLAMMGQYEQYFIAFFAQFEDHFG